MPSHPNFAFTSFMLSLLSVPSDAMSPK
jgi:hypothetical protein